MKCGTCKRETPDNAIFCPWCGKYLMRKTRDLIKVPTPKRLPNGKWRIYLRREKINIQANTPESCREQAIRERRAWLADEAAGLHVPEPEIRTLDQVVREYVDSRRSVLSPTTILAYDSMIEHTLVCVSQFDTSNLISQDVVNTLVEQNYSAKTVKNAWALCKSALSAAGVPVDTPTLPRSAQHERSWLDYNEIKVFLGAIEGKQCELGALLALHSLRESELLGLKLSDCDLKAGIIHVRGAAHKVNGEIVYTELNKNETSTRDVPIIIPRLTELLSKTSRDTEYLVAPKPRIYDQVNRICKANGLPTVGVHGLRHSFAPLAYHLGWKEKSTQAVGGWKNSKVLKEIYTHNADLEDDLTKMREFYQV